MNLLEALYTTYNNATYWIGEETDPENPKNQLLPVYHRWKKTHIEIYLAKDGTLKDINQITKEIIVPCTEKALTSRTSGPAPFPLHEELKYIANDLLQQSFEDKSTNRYHQDYLQQLIDWHDFVRMQISTEKEASKKKIQERIQRQLQAVLTYVQRRTILKDLAPFLSATKDNSKKFIRWSISKNPGDVEFWEDKDVYHSWQEHYSRQLEKKNPLTALCCITGRSLPIRELHPSVSCFGKAKLISSNDKKGFTFRGRFSAASQACSISCEVSEKAHLALNWLIARQGYYLHSKNCVMIIWCPENPSQQKIPLPSNSDDFIENSPTQPCDIFSDNYSILNTRETDAADVRKACSGYINIVKTASSDYIKILEPDNSILVAIAKKICDGRFALLCFRRFSTSQYMKHLEEWYRVGKWIQVWKRNHSKEKCTIGVPSPIEIALLIDQKQKKALHSDTENSHFFNKIIEDLYECILQRQPIPDYIINYSISETLNKISRGTEEIEYSSKQKTYSKAISGIICSILTKHYSYHNERSCTIMNYSRDYLYGMLLATAKYFESQMLQAKGKNNRLTHAEKLIRHYFDLPYTTWLNIYASVSNYLAKSKKSINEFENSLKRIMPLFSEEDFKSDASLSGEFLLGYYSHIANLTTKEDPAFPNRSSASPTISAYQSRNHLYGRLLAVAKHFEAKALKIKRKDRSTNAERLSSQFKDYPFSTWRTIYSLLLPYLPTLSLQDRNSCEDKFKEIMCLFTEKDFTADTGLSAEYTRAYYCELQDLTTSISESVKKKSQIPIHST